MSAELIVLTTFHVVTVLQESIDARSKDCVACNYSRSLWSSYAISLTIIVLIMTWFLEYKVSEPLVVCPSRDNEAKEARHIATACIFAIWSLLAAAFALVTMIKFNGLILFGKKLRTPAISNSLWIGYFWVVVLRGIVGAVRYTVVISSDNLKMQEIVFMVEALLQGLAGLILTLALKHQLIYRTATVNSLEAAQKRSSEAEPLLPTNNNNEVGTFRYVLDAAFVAIFLAYIGLVAAQKADPDSKLYFWLFMGANWSQQACQLILVILILILHENYGKSDKTKLLLTMGTILTTVNILPPTVWQNYLPKECTFYVGSLVDLLLLLDASHLVFFFFFLREEFDRNKNYAKWYNLNDPRSPSK